MNTTALKSNIDIYVNIMVIEDEQTFEDIKHIPGDLLKQINPSLTDVRNKHLTKRQKFELELYMICNKCKKSCAGTCK